MHRIFNFCSGPAMLPEEVLLKAKEELLDWHGTGMSIMEVSHRGEEFKEIMIKAEQDLREILTVPDEYHILFLTGGATAQFSMVPMNLLGHNKKADYINTGMWSKKAIAEAKQYGEVHIAAESESRPFVSIPPQENWSLNPDAAYVHYTSNETIDGVEFHFVPQTGDVPLIADMSSNILSRPFDINAFGLIYAGAQKNMGQAGITLVIIRDDLLQNCHPVLNTPLLYQYQVQASNHSLYNTPPTFSWYIAGLIFAWIKEQGGLVALAERNQRKAEKLYHAIDSIEMYSNPVNPDCRSWMNVPFSLKNEDLNSVFLAQAKEKGLENLAGHRSVGGMRASLYNAMPEAGVDALIDFMKDFARAY